MPQAERDLGAIGSYIAEDNPERAIAFTRELRDAAKGLSEWPERFPVVARYRHAMLRRRSYGNYAIFYHVAEEAVMVLRIAHGARDFASIFPDA